jgi:DNA-binding winged helix-turn-helix (wHTH) protein/TolB-like protein/Tfp pilus assembly protein PilF
MPSLSGGDPFNVKTSRESGDRSRRFADVVVELDRYCLVKGGESKRITPRAFEVLNYLIEHRERVVEKQELFEQIWKESFVSDNALTRAIREIRQVIGDDADAPRYIETIPKRGYRFIAEISDIPGENGGLPDTLPEERREYPPIYPIAPIDRGPWVDRKVAVKVAVGAIGLASIALALVLYFSWVSRRTVQPVTGMPRTIAVLPFKPLVADHRDEAFELGMADALITRLSILRHVIVRPTGAIRKYSTLDQDPIAAGREQRVDAVLEGSLHRSGEKVRVSARLIDTRDGSSLWSDRYDEYFTDIFAAQDAISEKIAKALAPELTGAERTRLAKRYTENTDAYLAYVKGRYFMDKRTEEGFNKAIEYFQQAIEKDPQYALAYAGLADCHHLLGGYGLLPPKETYPKAKAAAMKALEFDDQLAEAHTVLAVARARYDWDWAGAERDFKRALDLNPGYAGAHQWYGIFFLVVAEKFDDAIAEAKRAQEIDPLSLATGVNVAIANYFARRFDQSIEQSAKTLEMDPRFIQAYEFLGRAYEQKGKYDEAIAAFQEGLKLRSDYTHCLGPLGRAYAVSGRQIDARKILDQLKELSGRRYVMPYHIATIYSALGDKDQAFAWLQKAYDERDDRLVLLKVDPFWDGLRSDPRYANLVRAIGLSP